MEKQSSSNNTDKIIKENKSQTEVEKKTKTGNKQTKITKETAADKEEIQSKWKAATKEIEQLKTELENNNKTNELQLLTDKLAQLEKELANKEAEKTEIKSKWEAANKENEILKEKIKEQGIDSEQLVIQLETIKKVININYEMLIKINQHKNNSIETEIDQATKEEITKLTQMVNENENIINQYQNKMTILKSENNNCKEINEIEFYQNLINAKNNENEKIKERITSLEPV